VSINYSINVNVNAGPLQQNINASNITSTFATAGFLAVTLDVGTSTTAINTASASSLGLCFARSLVADTTGTHTVSLGRVSGTTLFDVVRLKAGDAALLRLAPGNYAARGAAEGGRLLLQILEE
jgi:hypothetical protein